MTEVFSFARLESGIAQAVQEGTRDSAAQLAESFRASGEQASVQTAPDGTAQVVLEGAATIAREFGTRDLAPARPAIGTMLAANRQMIRDAITRKITEALKGANP
jgi:hypothetical protein